MLECRLTPAANYWLGGDGQFLNAANWSDGIPTSSDDLIFGIVPNPDTGTSDLGSPPGGGTTISAGNFTPNVSVTFVSQSSISNTYSSIHIIDGYAGTITIPFNINFGGFVQTSGAINQDSPGQTSANTITVSSAYTTGSALSSSFAWTGSVLNSGANAGKVNIVGMTNATIGNGSDTSYTTGSDLRLLGGTIMSASGSIVFNNYGGLEIDQLCSARGPRVIIGPLPAQSKAWFDLIEGLNGHQTIKGIGEVLLRGDSWGIGKSELPVWVHGGTLHVVNQDMEVVGDFQTTINGQPRPADATTDNIYMTRGTINIRDDRRLTVNNRITMLGGLLTTQTEGTGLDGVTPATRHVSTIQGDLHVLAGTVSLSENSQAPNRATSTLDVQGNLMLVTGKFKPRVYCNNLGGPDRISNSGTILFGASFIVEPTVENKTAQGVQNNGQGLMWAVITSTMGPNAEPGGDPTVPDPTVPQMSPAADWEIPTLVVEDQSISTSLVINKKSNR